MRNNFLQKTLNINKSHLLTWNSSKNQSLTLIRDSNFEMCPNLYVMVTKVRCDAKKFQNLYENFN